MPERICEASLSEAIGLISDRKDLYGACCHRLRRGRVGLLDEKVEPDARSAQRLGAEIERLGRFIYKTEPCLADRQIDHKPAVRGLNPRDLDGAERRLIEIRRSGRVSHSENRRDRRDDQLSEPTSPGEQRSARIVAPKAAITRLGKRQESVGLAPSGAVLVP
jgi:hypothetical protein